jgi:hypothetical protein
VVEGIVLTICKKGTFEFYKCRTFCAFIQYFIYSSSILVILNTRSDDAIFSRLIRKEGLPLWSIRRWLHNRPAWGKAAGISHVEGSEGTVAKNSTTSRMLTESCKWKEGMRGDPMDIF